MTQQEFTAFYPQFAGFTPAVVLAEYIRQANSRFTSFAPEDAEEARRLYTAHKLTMYARAAPPGEPPETASGGNRYSYAQLAAAGRKIAGKKAGEVSVTYSSGISSAVNVSAGLAGLAETDFGLQLLGLIRLYGRAFYIR